MSQAELARQVGSTPEAVNRWLIPTNRIKLEDLQEIARIIGHDLTWFLGVDVPLSDAVALIRADRHLTEQDKGVIETIYRSLREKREQERRPDADDMEKPA